MPRRYYEPWADVPWSRAQPRMRSYPEPLRPARPVASPPAWYGRAAEPELEPERESIPDTVPPSAPPAPAPPPEPVDKAQLREALADLEAAKARVERDAERARDDAKASVVESMLPILDNLDRSIAAAEDSPDRALLEGIKLVRTQFEEALTRYGLERIGGAGTPFDPSVHEAVGVVEVDDPQKDGAVVDEWQRGYRFAGRVVRAPKVRVGRLV